MYINASPLQQAKQSSPYILLSKLFVKGYWNKKKIWSL